MTIQLDGNIVSTTMRTPGNDYELAAGFCFSDGLLAGAPVKGVRYCADGAASESEFNVVTVETGGKAPVPTPRLGTTTSSCGLCGNDAIEALCDRLGTAAADNADRSRRAGGDAVRRPRPARACSRPPAPCTRPPRSPPTGEVLLDTRGRRPPQRGRQGGRPHAARRPTSGHRARAVRQRAGQLRAGAEGVGRRVRHAGRGQRARPSLAVQTARRAGLTLAGFVRGDRLNVYAPERMQL